MGQIDSPSDSGDPRLSEPSFAPSDVEPAKETKGIDLSVEDPFSTIWTRPRATIRGIVDTDPEYRVILLATLGGVVNTLNRADWQNVGDWNEKAGLFVLCLIVGPVVGFLGLHVGGGLLQWTGSLLGGHASGPHVRAALAWSAVPNIASLAVLVFRFANSMPPTPVLVALTVVEIVLAIWSFVLLLKCLEEVQGFSTWSALSSSLLAISVIALAILSIVIIVAVTRWL